MKLLRLLLKSIATLLTLAVLAILAVVLYPHLRPAPKTIRYVATIHIPAPFKLGLSFIDYLTPGQSKLYAGYTTRGMVAILDQATNETLATIPGLGAVHGTALVPDLNLGFATSSGDNVIAVFDLATNRLLKRIPVPPGPDAIIYDAPARLIYVAARGTGVLIDPATQTVVAQIPLGGQPEFPQPDPQSGLIYQNLEDTSELIVLDPRQRTVLRRYPLAPGTHPTGLALDAPNHRLFSTCTRKLIVLNSDTGAIVATLPIGALTDAVSYDPTSRRIYTANGIGSITVIQQQSPDQYRVLEDAPTLFGGHALTIDPATHRIFVAAFGTITAYDPIP